MDCGFTLGSIDVPDLNKLINELRFYKEKFYKREIEDEKET